MEQFSQISTIKRQNYLNSKNYSKDYSELKYCQTSAIQQQSESLNIERLLTSIGKRQEPSFEISGINYMPVTNVSNFQQRKLNGSGSKNLKNSFCTTILNTTDPSLAIQSEPNSMIMGFSSYFDNEEFDYGQRICTVPEDHERGGRRILKLIMNLENKKYRIRFGFDKIQEHARQKAQLYVKSLDFRQLGFINLALKKRQDSFWHEKTHDKIGMPYYNKLMGLCAGELVANKKSQLIQKNVEKFKILKESSVQQVLQQSQVKESKYRFNFEIVPSLPLHFEKIANENAKVAQKKRK